MICYICKKEFENSNEGIICKGCDEAAYLCNAMTSAFNEWQKALLFQDEFWIGSKIFVKSLIEKVDKNASIIEQAGEVLKGIKEQIIHHLKFYNKDEAIIALLVVKESVRRLQLKENKDDLDWGMISDYDLSIRLLGLIIDICPNDFLGAPIGCLEDGYSNFISAICLGRILGILDENIRNSKFMDIKLISIDELVFNFIETEEMKKYYEEYWGMGLDEKPEDYRIKNELLNAKVDQEGKTPDRRRESINPFIKKEFGFTLDNLSFLSSLILREEFENENDFFEYCRGSHIYGYFVPELAIFNKCVLKALIEHFGNIPFDSIITTFSINQHSLSMGEKDEKALELMSVYETGELIVLGRIDFTQNVSAFDKFANSGHYIEMFKCTLKGDKSIIESQRKLSAYLSYILADRLYENGYKLPMEKLSSKMGGEYVPRAEINKIEINGTNILSEVGDLDVLALNQTNKIIFIIELKNYKPASGAKDLFYKDKNKIEDEEVMRKMKAREEVVNNNIESVVEYITGKKESDYEVKTLFVTTRPNYYACNQNEEIQSISWHNLIKKIERKEL